MSAVEDTETGPETVFLAKNAGNTTTFHDTPDCLALRRHDDTKVVEKSKRHAPLSATPCGLCGESNE